MTEKSYKKKPAAKDRKAKDRKAKDRKDVPTHATECPNLGCIKVVKDAVIDIAVDGEKIHCLSDEDENGHYEHIWRLTNDSGRAGFVVGYREGYKEGVRPAASTNITAKKFEWLCSDPPGYLETRDTKVFKLFQACRDIKCT